MISTGGLLTNIRTALAALAFCTAYSAGLSVEAKPEAATKSTVKQSAAACKTPAASKNLPLQSAPLQVKPSNGKPTVLEFGAGWCVPCKVFAPVFAKVKEANSGKVDFQSYDTESPEGEKIANKFGVSGLPTIIILDSSGKILFKKSGIMDEKALTVEVNKAIGK